MKLQLKRLIEWSPVLDNNYSVAAVGRFSKNARRLNLHADPHSWSGGAFSFLSTVKVRPFNELEREPLDSAIGLNLNVFRQCRFSCHWSKFCGRPL